MQITFNIHELSDEDRQLIGQAIGFTQALTATVEETVEEPPAAAPARRTRRAAPKRTEPVEEEPEDEPEEDEDDDLLGTDDEDEAPAKITKDDLIALGTSLVQKGKSADVKAALEEIGKAKISLVKTQADINTLHALLKKIK